MRLASALCVFLFGRLLSAHARLQHLSEQASGISTKLDARAIATVEHMTAGVDLEPNALLRSKGRELIELERRGKVGGHEVREAVHDERAQPLVVLGQGLQRAE